MEEDEILFDQFVIHASEIESMFKEELQETKNIKTNADNSYNVLISVKTDETAKLSALKSKID